MKASKKKQEAERVELEEVCALWETEGKKGNLYLKGLDNEKKQIVGFYRKDKKNPKEPDIVVCSCDEKGNAKDEIIALWSAVSKTSAKEYLYGKAGDENVVGFYTEKVEGKNLPKIRVYYREENKID